MKHKCKMHYANFQLTHGQFPLHWRLSINGIRSFLKQYLLMQLAHVRARTDTTRGAATGQGMAIFHTCVLVLRKQGCAEGFGFLHSNNFVGSALI